MEQIQTKLFELRELILKSPEYKDVKEKEAQLLDREKALIDEFNKQEQAYNDSIKYGYYDETYLLALQKAKEELYSNPLTKSYFDALNKMNKMLHEISEVMFDGVVPDLKIK